MSEPFIAEIRMFAGNFAPRGWAFCNGQILSIAQNTALFALIGTTYGGNGQTTFALPDLRSRIPVHAGQGPGLSNYTLGQSAGSETTTLNASNIPQFAVNLPVTGAIAAHTEGATTSKPASGGQGNFLASSTPGNIYLPNPGTPPDASLAAGSVTGTASGVVGGSSTPFDNIQPYLTINFIIAVEGIFPSRN
jgi:microcystin-dependent protein